MPWTNRLLPVLGLLLGALVAGCGGGGRSAADTTRGAAIVETSAVRGTLIDTAGKPVANAVVAVDDATTNTDAGGNFMLDLEPGEHSFTIAARDLSTGPTAFVVPQGPSAELGSLRLAPTDGGATLAAQVMLGNSNFDCGGYQQHNCTVIEWEYLRGGFGLAQSCDRGLQCGSDLKFCAIGEGVCRNDTRWQSKAEQVRQGWAAQALAEQRKIARHEPINWTATIAAHNAFNNFADGYVLKPNQRHSMTDQLQMGARGLMLDVHHVCGVTCEIRLSHAEVKGGIHLGASPGDRHFGFALQEIRQWLDRNPGEVILLHMEERLENDPESKADYAWAFEHFLGPYLLRVSEKPDGRWPTAAEMAAKDRRVIAFGDTLSDKDYFFQGFTSPWSVARPKYFDPAACAIDNGTERYALGDPGQTFVKIEESRYVIDIAGWTPFDGYTGSGVIAENCAGSAYPCAAAAAIAACGNAEVALDFVGDDTVDTMVPIGDRMGSLVWSWTRDERGWEQDGQAAVLDGASGRWLAREPSENHRYACGRLREGDPSAWHDAGQASDWKVTQSSGPFAKGGLHCALEFGAGYVFSLPVNGAQNSQLAQAMAGGGADAVWLAYRDIKPAAGDVHWDRDVPCVEAAAPTPGTLWPPNHKMAIVTLEVKHHCAAPPACSITGVSSDDPTATAADWRVTSALGVELRAERPGASKAGRRYAIELQCQAGEAGTTHWTGAEVVVPHDQR